MNSSVGRYITEALASSGLAVLDSRHAYRLRPDIWPTAVQCGCDWTEALPKLGNFLQQRGVKPFRAAIGGQTAHVAAWTKKDLAQRLTWITGAHVARVAAIELGQLDPPKTAPAAPTSFVDEKMKKRLRREQLAAQEPPAHDCPLRHEILKARDELARSQEKTHEQRLP